MATKPTSEPRWADVGGDIVEPASGKKDVGWVANERPPAQFFNWLLNTIYLWVAWLNSAVVDFGTATVQADDLQIDADATVDGLTTTENLTVNGDINNSGRDFVHGDYTDRLIPNNCYHSGETIPKLTGALSDRVRVTTNNDGNSVRLMWKLDVEQGARIKSARIDWTGNTQGYTLVWILGKYSSTGVASDLGTGGSDAGASGNMTITTPTEITLTELAAGERFQLLFTFVDTGGGASDIDITRVEFTYDRV